MILNGTNPTVNELIADWIAALPPQMILVIPKLALLESMVFIGLFVSGVFLLSACTLIYAQGNIPLPVISGLAFIGALTGDHIGYYLAYLAGPKLWRKKWIRKQVIKRKIHYRKFRRFLLNSAPLAICIGRLSPPLRSISPVIAGAAGLKPLQFFMYDFLACCIWAAGLSVLVIGINNI